MPENALPPEVYGVFCGSINQDSAQKITATIGVASNGGVKHIHLLFQSTGGTINEGIYLHNLFKSLPLKLSLYNGGQVSSIAAVAYLGTQSRKASASAVFMLHKSTNNAQGATSVLMGELSKSLAVDDGRIEGILKEHLALPKALWTKHKHHDLYLTAVEAVRYGLAEEIANFAPPFGAKLFSIG
jgi:ATP-dependent Clp protease protease subunit